MRGGPHFTTLAPHGGKALIEHHPSPTPHHGLPMAFPAQICTKMAKLTSWCGSGAGAMGLSLDRSQPGSAASTGHVAMG